jgi:hypothetical protein
VPRPDNFLLKAFDEAKQDRNWGNSFSPAQKAHLLILFRIAHQINSNKIVDTNFLMVNRELAEFLQSQPGFIAEIIITCSNGMEMWPSEIQECFISEFLFRAVDLLLLDDDPAAQMKSALRDKADEILRSFLKDFDIV